MDLQKLHKYPWQLPIAHFVLRRISLWALKTERFLSDLLVALSSPGKTPNFSSLEATWLYCIVISLTGKFIMNRKLARLLFGLATVTVRTARLVPRRALFRSEGLDRPRKSARE